MGDNTEMGTLAVTEELHAKQQEAARKEAERAARKAPQDAAADAKGEAGEPASKKGSAARSSRPPGRPAIGGRACRAQAGRPGDELDGRPVREAADLQLRLALLRIGEVAEFAVSRPGGAVTVRAAMAEKPSSRGHTSWPDRDRLSTMQLTR